MNTSLRLQIEALANRTPTVEVCGFIVLALDGLHLIPCPNVSATPEGDYEINAPDHLRAQSVGRILCVYHSHPRPGGFSEADRAYAEESLLPQRLFNVAEQRWYPEYLPSNLPSVPLLGRPWAWGEQDCLSLVRDCYRLERGITIGDYDRDETTKDVGHMVVTHFAREGFRQLSSGETLKEYDVLVLRTFGSPQHMAIFRGDSKMLHHPIEGLSVVDLYSAPWQRRLAFAARHGALDTGAPV